MGSGRDSFYLEIGAVRRLSAQLNELENPDRHFKLSNCLAISNFILNIIKLRCNEGYPPSLMKLFGTARFDESLQKEFFFDFTFTKPDGVTERQDSPTRYQVLNWIRNRITHYRVDLSSNDPPPWPRGIQIEERGPNGIRALRIAGSISSNGSPVISGRTDRRLLTKLVQAYVHDYMDSLGQSGIDTTASETARLVEEGT